MTSAYADTTCTEELASFDQVDPSPATLLRWPGPSVGPARSAGWTQGSRICCQAWPGSLGRVRERQGFTVNVNTLNPEVRKVFTQRG